MNRTLVLVGAVAAALAAIAASIVVFFPKDLVANELKKQVAVATGRTLVMDDDPGVTFWPALGLTVRNVRLSNPDGFEGDFLTAREVVFAVSAAPLLRGDVQITRLFLDAPKLALVARRDGTVNWTFPTKESQSKLKALRLDDATIADGILTYAGDDGGPPLEFSDIDANVSLASLDEPATLKGGLIYRGQAVKIETTTSQPRALFEQGATPLAIQIEAAPIAAGLDGAVDTKAGAITGKLNAQGASVRNLLDWLGSPLPPGRNFGAFNVGGRVNARLPTIAIDDGAYRLDAIAARGDVTVTVGDAGRLKVGGALAIPTLDLNPYLPTQGPAPTGVNTAAAWDATPMDVAGLRSADADLRIGVDDLRFQKLQFSRGQLRLAIRNGVADAVLSQVSLYDGAGTARLVVDASGATPTIRSEMDVRDVQALPLLSAAIGFDKIEGRGRLVASLNGRGRAQSEIMRSLGGTLAFSFSDGAWRGVNLAQVARQVQAVLSGEAVGAAAKTDFAEFAADYTVANGVATTQNLRLLNPFVRLDGKGTIDIGAQTLDMRLAPRAVRSAEGQGGDALARGLGVPFRARGPWSTPKFHPDGAAVAEQALGGRTVAETIGGLVMDRAKQKDPSELTPLERLMRKKQ